MEHTLSHFIAHDPGQITLRLSYYGDPCGNSWHINTETSLKSERIRNMHVKLIYSSSNRATWKGLARNRPWAGSGSTLIRLKARATADSVGHDRNVSTTNNALAAASWVA